MVKICIAGGREFTTEEHEALLTRKLDTMIMLYDDHGIEVISGTAKGADKMGEEWAERNGYVVHPHPPNYDVPRHLRRRAPLVRNEEMAQKADVLCAFWDGASTGTRHMIGCAMRQGLEVHIFRY